MKFGWKKENPDHNDMSYSAHPEMLSHVSLPSSFDLEKSMSAIQNQGNLSDCVAFSVAGACFEHMEILSIAKKNFKSPEYFSQGFEQLSKLYTYWFARKLDGTTTLDEGTTIRSAIRASQLYGMCRDKTWTYDESKVLTAPSDQALIEAQKHLLVDAFRIDHTSEAQIKTCLVQGYPIAFGMSLGEIYMSEQVARTGIVPALRRGERIVGGHAQAIIGYDDSKGRYKIRNSWGVNWGDHGHAWVLYSEIQGKMAADFWTLRPRSIAA
jgi:C1A family cysteine protease